MGARDHTVFLMYHELQRPGRPLCSADPGYVRYVVEETEFRAQLSRMAERGMRGVSVSDWIDHPISAQQRVVLTFDDGCETDLIAAAPILREYGFGATCYLTVDFLERPGRRVTGDRITSPVLSPPARIIVAPVVGCHGRLPRCPKITSVVLVICCGVSEALSRLDAVVSRVVA